MLPLLLLGTPCSAIQRRPASTPVVSPAASARTARTMQRRLVKQPIDYATLSCIASRVDRVVTPLTLTSGELQAPL